MSAQEKGITSVECPVCKALHLPQKDGLRDGVYAANCENCGHFFKFRAKTGLASSITLSVNGQKYTVGSEYSATTSLNEFLRQSGISMGTKRMCFEGGCGMCVVQAKLYEPIEFTNKSYPINSCLCPLFLCDGWEITTVEGIDHTSDKSVSRRLAKYNGSQCGFCSPAQVMNMHALLEFHSGGVTKKQVEDAFDAVICRCTGYRSILDAMKSFSNDSQSCQQDIEDLGPKMCKRTGQRCRGQCGPPKPKSSHLILTDAEWYRPTTVDELMKIITNNKGKSYKLVFGNTGFGVYKELGPWMYDVLIDIRGIQEMYAIDFDPTSILGANLSINQLVDISYRMSNEPGFPYFKEMYKIFSNIATNSVRSLGCWAGNLMLKHKHPEFQSDIYTLLEACGIKLQIGDSSGSNMYSMSEFLSMNMTDKVILSMVLNMVDKDCHIRVYKVNKRAQNAHSDVNAGIQMSVDASKNYLITKKPIIVFGGISKTFTHATQTEQYLVGKALGDPQTLKGAFTTLSGELNPESPDPVWTSTDFRKSVAMGLLYRFFLDVLGDRVNVIYRSGSTPLVRPLSSGQQSYDTKPIEWPLTEPITKVEELNQCSGKAMYINDTPPQPRELHAAFVLSNVANAKIKSIDPSDALKMPGVVKFLSSESIPNGGVNNCSAPPFLKEEVFASEQVDYHGQAIGLIVAEDHFGAISAAGAVKVTYTDQQPPILTLEEGIKQKSFFPGVGEEITVGDAEGAIQKSAVKVTGRISMGHQYHMHMETQITICTPTEDGYDVQTSTQWVDNCQKAIGMVLGIPDCRINIKVKRLGGAYGGKITRNFIVAAATALGAQATNRSVRMEMDFHTNMKMLGKRVPWLADYEVGVSEDGILQGVKMTYYNDCGNNPNENSLPPNCDMGLENAYYCPNWHVIPHAVKTNTPLNTACRAPGSCPTIFIMESVMEHVAKMLNMDPTEFRIKNLYQKGQVTPVKMPLQYCNIRELVSDLTVSAGINNRKQAIDTYNKNNRWKKKGLSVVPMKFGIGWTTANYTAQVAIHGQDGSVTITHGGIESGQGINTKVIQVCAYKFKIPMDQIQVRATDSFSTANSVTTGGSITSELCCQAVLKCCDNLLARINTVKAKMNEQASWKDVTFKCYQDGVDLSERCWNTPNTPNMFAYNSYGVTCTEVSLDVLTGQHIIDRVDILFDCGESVSPEIDIGQVEGAFVMGLGYFLQEEIKYDSQTGKLLTDGTWEYKVPFAKDIPVDFRIQLLKNAPNPLGVLRAKACGEPPLCMSCSALFAVKHAIEAVRKDLKQDTFFALNAPATVEKVQQLCMVDPSQFVI